MSIKNFQKFLLHPITALLLAFGTARFIHAFNLLEFPYAATASFVFVCAGYLLLSRKYDAILSFIFLGAALFVGYKALVLGHHTVKPAGDHGQVITKKLSALAALVHYSGIEKGVLPQGLGEVGGGTVYMDGFTFTYCRCGEPCQKELYLEQKDCSFVISARSVLQDPAASVWLITDGFEVYKDREKIIF